MSTGYSEEIFFISLVFWFLTQIARKAEYEGCLVAFDLSVS